MAPSYSSVYININAFFKDIQFILIKVHFFKNDNLINGTIWFMKN